MKGIGQGQKLRSSGFYVAAAVATLGVAGGYLSHSWQDQKSPELPVSSGGKDGRPDSSLSEQITEGPVQRSASAHAESTINTEALSMEASSAVRERLKQRKAESTQRSAETPAVSALEGQTTLEQQVAAERARFAQDTAARAEGERRVTKIKSLALEYQDLSVEEFKDLDQSISKEMLESDWIERKNRNELEGAELERFHELMVQYHAVKLAKVERLLAEVDEFEG